MGITPVALPRKSLLRKQEAFLLCACRDHTCLPSLLDRVQRSVQVAFLHYITNVKRLVFGALSITKRPQGTPCKGIELLGVGSHQSRRFLNPAVTATEF